MLHSEPTRPSVFLTETRIPAGTSDQAQLPFQRPRAAFEDIQAPLRDGASTPEHPASEPDLTSALLPSSLGNGIQRAPETLGSPLLYWLNSQSTIPRLKFEPVNFLLTKIQAHQLAACPTPSPFQLSYRLIPGPENLLVRATLAAHGFREAFSTHTNYNLIWAAGRVEPHLIRSLNRYQKINRFPRSNEITRKDKLHANIFRMKQAFSHRSFEFMLPTFLLPLEYELFYREYLRAGGRWQCRIFGSSSPQVSIEVESLSEIPKINSAEERVIMQKALDNPLLIDGYRFTLQIYLAITSISPLRVYIYEEGCAVFEAERYEALGSKLSKHASAQKFGHQPPTPNQKWSLNQLLSLLSSKYGSEMVELMMAKIKDLSVKMAISAEPPMAVAANMFVPHSGCCFELFVLDLVIDENLSPWLVEVHSAAGLECECDADFRLKAPILADLLTMVGLVPYVKAGKGKRELNVKPYKPNVPLQVKCEKKAVAWDTDTSVNDESLTPDQKKMIKSAKEENSRSGGFIRVFPAENSSHLYFHFFSKGSPNHTLLLGLFGKSALKSKRFTNHSFEEAVTGNMTFRIPHGQTCRQRVVSPPWAPADAREMSMSLGSREPESDAPIARKAEDELAVVDLSDEENSAVDSGASLAAFRKAREYQSIVESISNGAKHTDDLMEKLAARDAFVVFLESILNRLHTFYNQTDDMATQDAERVYKEMEVVHKFLEQAGGLKPKSESEAQDSDTEDSLSITDRLESFIKEYKKQTEAIKKGEIMVKSSTSTPANSACSSEPASGMTSARSSRPSSARPSRPSSASRSGASGQARTAASLRIHHAASTEGMHSEAYTSALYAVTEKDLEDLFRKIPSSRSSTPTIATKRTTSEISSKDVVEFRAKMLAKSGVASKPSSPSSVASSSSSSARAGVKGPVKGRPPAPAPTPVGSAEPQSTYIKPGHPTSAFSSFGFATVTGPKSSPSYRDTLMAKAASRKARNPERKVDDGSKSKLSANDHPGLRIEGSTLMAKNAMQRIFN
ncbi:tubulin-tyrosine ligase family-domain-containing protein [Polychytrium aggregatum]|uniref:tubulin-tyrosine ligase family-domain-containing protein n=1 Tax=Polychytrium aggregatum TaxID=110093 RepID=UPI0022FEE535|nr:tubulin-tyrosine ligase family-domain-containing protein [Polychytrium aggregatum]KAI9209477.1 tubulin-tyrosine ligase family-domain-containing protein [Polychytrium aggregatum]